MDTIICHDIYVEYGNRDGSRSHVISHRVWDSEKFMSARNAECAKNRVEGKEPSQCQQLTEAQYLEAMK